MLMPTLPLNKRQVVGLARKMGTRRENLEKATALLWRDRYEPEETLDEAHDMKDQASEDALEEMRFAHRRPPCEEVRELEEALARMHSGSYGICTDCGADIGITRLRVCPTAQRCRGCQGVYERSAKRLVVTQVQSNHPR